MIAVEYHADLAQVQGDPRLAALLAGDSAAAPFDRIAWWRALAEECGMAPLLAVARAGEDRAVLPLTGDGGHLRALANWYAFRVRPVISPGADGAALLAALAADLARRAWRVTLSPLPDDDGEAALVAAAFRAAGWRVWSEQCDVNHVLRVEGRCWAEVLAARPGQLRTTLKRKASKVDISLYQEFTDETWSEYETVYRASWKPEEGSPAFLRRFAREEAEAGRLRLGIARAGGRAIAAQFWTVEGNTAFIHKLAHLEESRPLSPGTSLSAALFEQVIDRDRVALIDFGTGDDPYKRDWMEQVRPRFRLDMMRPLHPRSWPVIARTGLRRLAAGAKHG